MKDQKLLLAVGGGLIALFFAVTSFAVCSSPDGWYLEANAGSTQLSNKSYPSSSSASSSGIGGNANVGYKFMPYFATEIGYTLYANTSITNSSGTKAGTNKIYSYDVAFRGILPIVASGAEAFAKLGAGRLNTTMSINNAAAANSLGLGSASHSATGLYMAIGAQYYFVPELAVVAQWARAQGNSSTGNLDLLSGGVSFIFD